MSLSIAQRTARVSAEGPRGGPDPDEIFYEHAGESAVRHLFNVASGLDSMVLGETEILGQPKAAYQLALDQKSTGGRLNKAFQKAFNVAKQIRTETNIQRGSVSVANVAVELAGKIFDELDDRTVMIGAGDTGRPRALLARRAERDGVNRSTIVRVWPMNSVAARLISIIGKPSLRRLISSSGTNAPHYVIDRKKLEPLQAASVAVVAGGYRRAARHRAGG